MQAQKTFQQLANEEIFCPYKEPCFSSTGRAAAGLEQGQQGLIRAGLARGHYVDGGAFRPAVSVSAGAQPASRGPSRGSLEALGRRGEGEQQRGASNSPKTATRHAPGAGNGVERTRADGAAWPGRLPGLGPAPPPPRVRNSSPHSTTRAVRRATILWARAGPVRSLVASP